MRLTFHGGVLLAAISAETAAMTLTDTNMGDLELAQTALYSEADVNADLYALEDKKKKDDKKSGDKKEKKQPKGIMAGLGQMAGGLAK